MNWYFEVLKKYAVFDGRARRQEYWMFALFNFIISLVLGIARLIAPALAFIGLLYGLGVLIPGLAVGVRRLHDTNKSGWWLLISLIPLAGVIILLVFLVSDSDSGPNQYGPNPKMGINQPSAYPPPGSPPPVNTVTYCQNCGTPAASNQDFCANCGNRLVKPL